MRKRSCVGVVCEMTDSIFRLPRFDYMALLPNRYRLAIGHSHPLPRLRSFQHLFPRDSVGVLPEQFLPYVCLGEYVVLS